MDHPAPKVRPPTPTRRPYAPPSVLHADELRFETELQCANIKTIPCAPIGCLVVQAS